MLLLPVIDVAFVDVDHNGRVPKARSYNWGEAPYVENPYIDLVNSIQIKPTPTDSEAASGNWLQQGWIDIGLVAPDTSDTALPALVTLGGVYKSGAILSLWRIQGDNGSGGLTSIPFTKADVTVRYDQTNPSKMSPSYIHPSEFPSSWTPEQTLVLVEAVNDGGTWIWSPVARAEGAGPSLHQIQAKDVYFTTTRNGSGSAVSTVYLAVLQPGPGDINPKAGGTSSLDGVVDVSDLLRLAVSYGADPSYPNWDNGVGDINGSGSTGPDDLLILAGQFGFNLAWATVRSLYAGNFNDPVANAVEDPTTGLWYDTIQAAVDAAASGDTLVVWPGTYAENVDLQGKTLTLQSYDPALPPSGDPGQPNPVDVTIIDGGGNGTVISNAGDSTISGLTIQNGAGEMPGEESQGEPGGIDGGALVSNCVIQDNTGWDGGGIKGAAAVTGCTIVNNTAADAGGGLADCGTVSDCTIQGNSADSDGGGIWGAALVTGCTISNNSAGQGGGIEGGTEVIQCVIDHNSATGSGGGMDHCGTICNCVIHSNAACWGGGASEGGSFYSCLIVENTALYVGGGLWIRNGYVNGCTIADNACLAAGGGLAGYAGGVEPDYGYTLYLDSCIIYGNQSLIEPQIGDDGTSIVTYCDVQGGYSGTGNIDADPLFSGGDMESVGMTAYDLQTGSPCVSEGNPAYTPTTVGGFTETAIDGGPRIPDTVVNMGAF